MQKKKKKKKKINKISTYGVARLETSLQITSIPRLRATAITAWRLPRSIPYKCKINDMLKLQNIFIFKNLQRQTFFMSKEQ